MRTRAFLVMVCVISLMGGGFAAAARGQAPDDPGLTSVLDQGAEDELVLGGDLPLNLELDLGPDPGSDILQTLTEGPAPDGAPDRDSTPARPAVAAPAPVPVIPPPAPLPEVPLPPGVAEILERAMEATPEVAPAVPPPAAPEPSPAPPAPKAAPASTKAPPRSVPALPPVSVSGPAVEPPAPPPPDEEPVQALPREPAPVPPATPAWPPALSPDPDSIAPPVPPLPPLPFQDPAPDSAGLSGPAAASGRVTMSDDVASLKAFRLAVDPDGKLGWTWTDTVAGPGLGVDDQGRLVSLRLAGQGLGGALALAGAGYLTELSSAGNPFLDLKLSDLPRLRTLGLSGAGFDRLKAKTFAGLPGLLNIDLSRGQLVEIEPGAFSGLEKLETLRLTDNRLSRLGRNAFAEIPTLSELHLDRNRISAIAWGGLSALSDLIGLNLAHNRLSEVGNGFFPGLSSLEMLHLENNRITRIAPDAFADTPSLKFIDLSDNWLSWINPPVLAGLTSLGELNLERNCLPLGALKTIRDSAPDDAYLYLGGQNDVYFTLRVQYLPKNDTFVVPAGDAFINGLPSHGQVAGDDPAGATYTPAEIEGRTGRLTFHRPGLYRLILANSGLSPDTGVSAATGLFLVVDQPLDVAAGIRKIGNRDLVNGLAKAISTRGFVEVSGYNPRRVEALIALFRPGSDDD